MTGHRAIAGLAGLVGALAFAGPVAATPPAPLSGSGAVTSVVVTSSRTTGENTHLEQTITGILTGSLSGTFVVQRDETIHPSGDATVHDSVVATATTPCGTGSFAAEIEAMIVGGVYEGHSSTIDASTNTANLHASIDVLAPGGPFFTYSGTYHCD